MPASRYHHNEHNTVKTAGALCEGYCSHEFVADNMFELMTHICLGQGESIPTLPSSRVIRLIRVGVHIPIYCYVSPCD
jgi:hypothetical protein